MFGLLKKKFGAANAETKMKILKGINDVKNNPEEAEEVFLTMVTIAEADGKIDNKEMAILKEVGTKIGVRLSDYGL